MVWWDSNHIHNKNANNILYSKIQRPNLFHKLFWRTQVLSHAAICHSEIKEND